ncbi:MAG: CHAT domain-containing protein, partial [Saprospiraceae bacterium]|nr:CHAT domain-containing protein [Saprospiraceae bacterium]
SPPDLHRYDAQIKRYYEQEKRDSFMFFAQEKSKTARQADSLALWGWVQYRIQKFFSDNPAEALRRIEQTFRQQWRQPANADEAEPLLYLYTYQADYCLKRGLLVSAVSAGESAAALFERYRYADFDATESVYKALGNNYTRLGDNEKALVVFQKALLTSADDEVLSGLYNNIGTAYWNSDNYTAAEAYFRKGLALKQVSDARRGLLLAGLAQVQLDGGQAVQACQTAAQSLVLLRRASTTNPQTVEYLARAYRTAGEAATAAGRYSEAEQLLSMARKQDAALPPRDRGKIEIARAQLALLRGKPYEAMEAANEALHIVIPNFKPEKANDNPVGRDFYEENVIFEALAVKAEAAERWHQKNGGIEWLYVALNCHDLAWQAEMRLRDVFRYRSSKLGLQSAARVREEAAMRVAYALYAATQKPALILRGFAIAERSKDMLLRDALEENIAQRQQASGDARFGQLRLLRRNLAYFEKRILMESASDQLDEWRQSADDITTQIAGLEFALRKEYPQLYERKMGVRDYSSLVGIPAGGLLVEYFVTEAFIDVFVCAPDKALAWHRLPNDQAMRDLTGTFLAFFDNANAILAAPDTYFQTAYALWQKILPPEAATADKLTIVPDGFLNFIPFEALLYERAPPGSSLRSAPYLLQKQHLFYAWSLSTLRRQGELKSLTTSVLLGIAPGFSQGERGLAPLLSSREEWNGMTHFDLVELTEQQATAERLLQRAAQARILHFSTHAFAGDNPRIELYDNALLLPDIYTLPIQADLVVLSACETGLGKEQKGEGVMSLARAFASSGAACVVSSLWSVNDRSTARLFSRFYAHLGEKIPTGDALRQAKLDYLSDPAVGATTQSPYFWAGFLAIGAEREMNMGWRFVGTWMWWASILAVVLLVIFGVWRYSIKWNTDKTDGTRIKKVFFTS